MQAKVAWADETNINVFGLGFTLVLALGLLLLPRRWASFTLLALACFIPAGQRVVVATLDFTFLRILVLFGWLRIVARQEQKAFRLCALDVALLAWAFAGVLSYTLLHGTTTALVFKLGDAYDAIGTYFLFRCLIREMADLDHIALAITYLAIPVCLALVLERLTGRNLFAAFGGVPEFTEVREGRLRCQGAFPHAILAGCFWAAVWPLIAARWWGQKRSRFLAVIGSLCAGIMIVLSASSTPIFAAAVAILGGCSFLARRFMSVGRVMLVAGAVGLHLLMRAPIWHLLMRVNVVGGSTGWHRYYLIDETIKHFDEWWLLGTPSTEHWGPGLSDLTNQYVLEAAQGGLLGLCLFVGLILLGFRYAGYVWRSERPNRASVALSWALGVSLLVQCVSFVGVAYFGQVWILWFLVLACIGSLNANTRSATKARADSLQYAESMLAPMTSQREGPLPCRP